MNGLRGDTGFTVISSVTSENFCAPVGIISPIRNRGLRTRSCTCGHVRIARSITRSAELSRSCYHLGGAAQGTLVN